MPRSDTLDGEFSLYRQVETILRDQIADGVLRAGDKLPAEEALREQFGVSRGTLRHAFDALEQDGLLERARGRGTFVASGVAGAAPRSRMILEAMIATARKAGTIERQGRSLPPPVVGSVLHLMRNVEVPFVIRVSRAGEASRIGIKRYLVPELGRSAEGLVAEKDFDGALARLGATARGTVWAEAILAEPRFSMLLKVPLGSPLLSLWWVDLLEGKPVACTQMLRAGASAALEIHPEGEAR